MRRVPQGERPTGVRARVPRRVRELRGVRVLRVADHARLATAARDRFAFKKPLRKLQLANVEPYNLPYRFISGPLL